MNKRVFIVFLLVAAVLTAVSCSKPAEAPVQQTNGGDAGTDTPVPADDNGGEEDKGAEKPAIVDGVVCPLGGEIIERSALYQRPVAVMMDNHSNARPQAGLDQAEVVYEILAEGNITRYMAIFMHGENQVVGPVRSARRYFIDKSMEYDSIYVHAGGSPEAWDDVARLKIPSFDAMSMGAPLFWREKHKKEPHNMYSALDEIQKAADKKGYNKQTEVPVHAFNSADTDLEGDRAEKVSILYPPKYTVSYEYRTGDKLYYRSVMGKPHFDEVAEDYQINAKNIIIQKAAHKVVDNEGRRKIDLVGKGEGIYITNGSYVEITWEKKDRRAPTRFYSQNGEQIKLNPGKTWIQVVPFDAQISIE
ncbi:MAG: putative lipoprotein YerB [Firmicutes bacterium]|nr:putative lipoprotein YerB [Bacillota bacterium]